ncbi:MAG TPA: hypothetical protein VHJ83_04010 [Micromonosporaceae bacterium]|jgi:hypothetical protein|nr:hypothetical protein [Micromonosporaceae bacterium]
MPVSRIRLGAGALAVAGVLFLAYPATRPWHDESTLEGATRAMSSGWWVASHLFAVIGFILVPLGLLAVCALAGGTRAGPLGLSAVVTSWIGAGLTLPYYGAEAFALNAIAGSLAEGRPLDLLTLVDAIRFDPVAATTFAVGLFSLAAGAVLAAVVIWRSRVLPRYSGVPMALGFVLFIPQFYTPPAVRIGHGVLLALGLGWLAMEMWQATSDRVKPAGS